jgi:hypothetical protein
LKFGGSGIEPLHFNHLRHLSAVARAKKQLWACGKHPTANFTFQKKSNDFEFMPVTHRMNKNHE